MTKREQRQKKKLLLLQQIEQQRLDMAHSTEQWRTYTAPLDQYWQIFIRVKKFVFIGAGILILFNLRKPSKALKLSKAVVNAWGVTRLVQKLFITGQKI